MAYHQDSKEALSPFTNLTSPDHCFECGQAMSGASVRYDGHADTETMASIHLHPACAAVMGQRLIVDGYPNRRHGAPQP